MNRNTPCVSIGMPVFNGELYLAEALDSLLSQTYENFELLIADNASTDRTETICRRYVASDRRIRYYRHQTNLGAARNYNYVYELSAGKYFKWAAHDDLCAPEFIERCVDVLEHDASAILCYARTMAIDEHGDPIAPYPAKPNLGSTKAPMRFFECVCVPHPQVAIFGVMRASILRRTRLIGNYAASDRPLLAELCLRGRFHELSEFLFFYRNHLQQSWQAHSTYHAQQAWYDPARAKTVTFPHWRLLREHFLSVQRAPLSRSERRWCYLYLGWWMRLHWRYLAHNLLLREPSR
jgi:glycosyltransferase involved in cell wall biosynthesis